MNIQEIKCYQHVKFGSLLVASFNISSADPLRDKKLEMVLENGIVRISQGKTVTLVPLNNVAFLIPVDEQEKKKNK